MAESEQSGQQPEAVILDLGRHKRKKVKKLRKGQGPLLEEVRLAVADLKENGVVPADATTVVVVVREKERDLGLWPLRM